MNSTTTSKVRESKLDVLVLSPTPSYPLDFGNRKRVYQVCAGLKARGARISFVYYPLEGDWRGHCPAFALDAMRAQWDDFHLVPPTIPVHMPPRDGEHHKIDEWWDPGLEAFLKWYVAARHFDAMVVNYTYLSRALTLCPRRCVPILETHDRFAGRRELLASIGISPEFFYTTEEEEKVALSRADVVVAIKEQEQALFEKAVDRQVVTLPFSGARQRIDPPAPDEDGYLRVGMLGARNNVNFFNVRRFLELAIPRCKATLAPVQFVLAGSMCIDLAKLYPDNPMIKIMGVVDAVEEFYGAVDVALIPMEISSGQKIKVGEALTFGLPVIAHKHAFEGYAPAHRLHECSSLEQMVEICIDAAFDRRKLEGLAGASDLSCAMQEQVAARALDTITSYMRSGRPHEAMIVDAKRIVDEPLLKFHLLSMGHLVASYARVTFLLFGDVAPEHYDFIVETRAWAKICATGDIEPRAVAENVEQVKGLADFERKRALTRMWLYDVPDPNAIADSTMQFVVVPELSNVSKKIGVAPLVNGDGVTFATGALLQQDGDEVEFSTQYIFCGAAMDAHRALLYRRAVLPTGRPAVCVVASKENAALATAIADMIFGLGRGERVLLAVEGDAPSAAAPSEHVRLVSPSDLIGRSPRFWPATIIDLTNRFDATHRRLLAEMAYRDYRIWRPRIDRAQGDAAGSGGSVSALDLTAGVLDAIGMEIGGLSLPTPARPVNRFDLSGVYNRLVTDAAYAL